MNIRTYESQSVVCRLDSYTPESPDWLNQQWIYHSGHHDDRLDLDLEFRAQRSAGWPMPPLPPAPPPS